MKTKKQKDMVTKGGRLPDSLRPFFWDTDFSRFFPDEHAFFIISRLLEHGDESAVKFLLNYYSADEIVFVVTNSRSLPRRSRKFWAFYFNIEGTLCTPKQYPTPYGIVSGD